MSRPSFDSIFMELATMMSTRATCHRLKVGCVIVSSDNHRILSIGYNGGAMGLKNECDSSEPGNCGCIHAEENALIKLNFNDPSDKKLLVTMSPCLQCAKRIVNAKIPVVMYLNEYRKMDGVDLLREAGIQVSRYLAP